MTDLKNVSDPVPVSPSARRTWDFWETTLIALIADGAFVLTGGVLVSIILAVNVGPKILAPGELQALASQGRWYGVALISGTPPAIAVLWIAIRMAGREFGEYLALNWPTGGEIVRALAIMTIVLSIEDSCCRRWVREDISPVPRSWWEGPRDCSHGSLEAVLLDLSSKSLLFAASCSAAGRNLLSGRSEPLSLHRQYGR
ncbi:hypothetical protein AYJ54_40430 [Bradyrhizobium centrolobii]|uniref:Uncharacterized protein n=1 Tax=Bradyrhizobium centrolobii TaxID=1505087 RepID=A0A176Z6H7_9BRAD|nr:hypothetical protein AYJ54_40430 [Bradyrhizobium centrolobii]